MIIPFLRWPREAGDGRVERVIVASRTTVKDHIEYFHCGMYDTYGRVRVLARSNYHAEKPIVE